MSDTVVLCGSLGSTSAMWDPQQPVLAKRRTVRVDHPGHGGEPLIALDDVRDLAQHVLEHVDAAVFSFVGLSLGGAVGMRIAVDNPQRIDKLMLSCTSARFGEPDAWLERAETVRAHGVEAVADAILGRWFTRRFGDVGRYREMLLSTDREGYARCCEAIAGWDVREELERIEAPTLVVTASEDPSTPPEHAELIAARIPGARLEVLGEAAHLANVERPAEFNRLLEEHL